jgi:hypothetical protein
MFDFNDLKNAKAQTAVRDLDNIERGDELFLEAADLFEQFQEEPAKEILIEASNKLAESFRYCRSNGKAFLLMSYIYYLIDNSSQALKNLKLAEELEPDLEEIAEFRDFLTESPRNYDEDMESAREKLVPIQVQENTLKLMSSVKAPPVIRIQAKSFFNKIKLF